MMAAVPGEAEARAALAAAREAEADAPLAIQRAEQEVREAKAVRARLLARVASGSADADPVAFAEADRAIAIAEERVAIRQEAVAEARRATKSAEMALAGVLRAECRRRAPFAKAAAAEGEARYIAASAERKWRHGVADNLANVTTATPLGTLERTLAESADLADDGAARDRAPPMPPHGRPCAARSGPFSASTLASAPLSPSATALRYQAAASAASPWTPRAPTSARNAGS